MKRGGNEVTYGYARVSAADQNLERQTEQLLNFGVEQKNLFCEKKSGKDFCREEYLRMRRKLKKGDVLVIKSIDRLGRDYRGVLAEWSALTKEREVDIVVLDMPLLDTREQHSLIGKFIADIVLQILSFVAENERANIRARQAEGIALAKARGVHMGRPRKEMSESFLTAAKLFSENKLTLAEALEATGLKRQTFLYHFRRAQEKSVW